MTRATSAVLFVSLVGIVSGASLGAGESDRSRADLVSVCLSMVHGTFDATGPAANDVPSDVPAALTLVGGTIAAYYGFTDKFRAVEFMVGTPGLSGTVDWTYSTSTGWRDLRLKGEAPDFQEAGSESLDFHPPRGWAPAEAPINDCPGAFYYVKSTTGVYYENPPLLSRASAVL